MLFQYFKFHLFLIKFSFKALSVLLKNYCLFFFKKKLKKHSHDYLLHSLFYLNIHFFIIIFTFTFSCVHSHLSALSLALCSLLYAFSLLTFITIVVPLPLSQFDAPSSTLSQSDPSKTKLHFYDLLILIGKSLLRSNRQQ